MPKSDPLKVLVVCGSLGVGGAEMQAARMLPRLNRDLFDLKVIYYNNNPGPPRDELVAQGIPVTFIGRPEWRRTAYLREAWDYMRRGNFDLVHAWSASANHYGRLPAMLAGIPVTVGGLLGQGGLEGIWPAVYSVMNPFCAGWIVNSESLRDFALSRMALNRFSPIVVVPNGIDMELNRAEIESHLPFYAGLKRDRPVIGMVARLHPVKNHGLLLAAAQILRDRGVVADYWVIGDGPARAAIEQAISQRGLGDCVRMLGQRNDVAAAYEMMDLAVLTSDSEGCPNALLEAMRASLPVISTRCTSLGEVIAEGRNGYTVAIGAADALADRIACLLNDEGLRRQFGTVSRHMVEKAFSMPVAVRRLEQAYLGFLRSSRVRNAPFREKLARLGVA